MAVSEVLLPDLGEGLEEAEIVAWHVAPGDRAVADQPIVSVETDKAVVEVPAPWPGTVVALLARAGEVVRVGSPLVSLDTAARADPGAIVGDIGARPQGSAPAAPPGPSPVSRPVRDRARQPLRRAIPAARALASAAGIDLSGVRATGPGGAIMRADVADALDRGAGEDAGWTALSGARRAMARRMALAAEVVPATLQDAADVTVWMHRDADVLARLVRACAAGAHAEPALNAWFDPEGPRRRLHAECHLGIAVDTPAGLYVPVLRDAGHLTADALRPALDRLVDAARERRLQPQQQRGATVTLSSFGALGGCHATLVVVPPQVAILGAGRARETAAWEPDGPRRRVELPLSLSFDHRAATGGEAARFLAAVIADLERSD